MSISGIHRGTLRKYGGFVFKQWKERYLVLTADGSLLLCRDAAAPPDQMVALHSGGGGCEAVVEGREILDLPRLPPGGRRDCCFALILPLDRFLLLMADTPEDCSQWLNMLRKVRESLSPHLLPTCRRHQAPPPRITDRDPLPDPPVPEKEAEAPPPVGDVAEASLPGSVTRGRPTQKDKGKKPSLSRGSRGAGRPAACLRHGTSYDAPAVKAVYLLMGGAAASSAMGYLGGGAPSNVDAARVPHLPAATGFAELGGGGVGTHHACGEMVDSPHFHSFEFEAGDSDFDAFDCGGFSF